MQVIVQGMKMDLVIELNKQEESFVKKMAKKGFIFTYYQGEDKDGEKSNGSIKEISLKLKSLFKV